MSTLREYLLQKRDALLARREQARAAGYPAHEISARVTAEGRSGVRRIRIRQFQLISDSPADFAGYDLGPTSPESQLGVLGSCLTHIFLIKAAELQVPLDSLEVEVHGVVDPRGGLPEFPDVPVEVHGLRYTVTLSSPATPAELEHLHAEVERVCPVLNLLTRPQTISGTLVNTAALDAA
ncbi:OsmC family protein [Allostreptomyces psammosilenae]|uniref:Putative OsmC-like protein n=1 Tax=Allostreptomyces psammosilenae TaxID=1892865 RepID=A0A852ZYU7_9ACTN|nr:OsmC family protein [Allostreptomyces psammosilenae]NYI07329.1 putative OsmC-like protein [Allostreptomyces psammosilenae]